MSKKIVYNKLVAKVKAIDTSAFVFKTKYDTDKSDLEKKICYANVKFTETEVTYLVFLV